MQSSSHWVRRAQLLAALGLMLAFAACSAGGAGANTGSQTNTTPTSTPATTPTTPPTPTPPPTPPPSPTPTLTPPNCGPNFTNPNYVSTLPDATAPQTNVFAQVQLPPATRSYDNDAAGGFRGRNMCSGGSTADVINFMTQHLTQQGWQMQGSLSACNTAIPNYAQNQCWQNSGYALFIGINSATDWIITFRDPNFQ